MFEKNTQGMIFWGLFLAVNYLILIALVIAAFLKILIKKKYFIQYRKILLSKSLDSDNREKVEGEISESKIENKLVPSFIIHDEEKGEYHNKIHCKPPFEELRGNDD